MRPKTRSTAFAIVLAAALSASGGGPAASPTHGGACSREATRGLIGAFVRAYNAGDALGAEGRWAQEPGFEWYFVDDEREGDAEDRVSLATYFQQRAGFGDRLSLRSLRVKPDGENFSFVLRRTTDDPRDGAGGLFHGKGSAGETTPLPSPGNPLPAPSCLLTVWSMDNHRR